MNIEDCQLEIRYKDSLEILDLSFIFLRHDLSFFLRLSFYANLPLLLLFGLWIIIFQSIDPILILALLYGLTLSNGLFTIAAGHLVFTQTLSIKEVFKVLREKLYPYLKYTILSQLYTLGGLLLLIIPGTIVYFKTLFVQEAVLLENLKDQRVFERSMTLTSGQLDKTFGAYFILIITTIGILPALLSFFYFLFVELVDIEVFFGYSIWDNMESLLGVLVFLLALIIQPLLMIFRLLLYINFRIFKEGWDIQVNYKIHSLKLAKKYKLDQQEE